MDLWARNDFRLIKLQTIAIEQRDKRGQVSCYGAALEEDVCYLMLKDKLNAVYKDCVLHCELYPLL